MAKSVLLGAVALVGAAIATSATAVTPLTVTNSVAGGAAANTAPTLSASVPFVANPTGRSATSFGTRSATSINLNKFDTNTGILIGARVGVSGVATASNAQVSGTVKASGGNRTVDASTSLVGAVSGVGITNFSNAATVATRSCSGGNCTNSPGNAATSVAGAALTGTRTVSAGSLGSYAGVGTVALGRSTTGTATVTTGSGATSGTADGFYSFTGGTYSIAYDYVNFASPSFIGNTVQTGRTLDFGSRLLSNTPVTLNFSLFNIGNVNTADVALTGITRDFNTSAFSSNLAPVTNLVAGSSTGFSVTFMRNTVGSFTDTFRLAFADNVPGGVGGKAYNLDLVVSGSTLLPEPGTWAMLLVGFGFIGTAVRRRQAVVTA